MYILYVFVAAIVIFMKDYGTLDETIIETIDVGFVGEHFRFNGREPYLY